MSSSVAERARYARQILLPEIGQAGQARLCAASIAKREGSDAAAWSVAQDYLQRAGVTTHDDDTTTGSICELASAQAVDTIAGSASLRHAAAALVGAFAAVESIKTVVAAGKPATLPSNFVLISEES